MSEAWLLQGKPGWLLKDAARNEKYAIVLARIWESLFFFTLHANTINLDK